MESEPPFAHRGTHPVSLIFHAKQSVLDISLCPRGGDKLCRLQHALPRPAKSLSGPTFIPHFAHRLTRHVAKCTSPSSITLVFAYVQTRSSHLRGAANANAERAGQWKNSTEAGLRPQGGSLLRLRSTWRVHPITDPSSVCALRRSLATTTLMHPLGRSENTFSFSVFIWANGGPLPHTHSIVPLSSHPHPHPHPHSHPQHRPPSSALAGGGDGGDGGGAGGAEARESNQATSSQFSFSYSFLLFLPSLQPLSLSLFLSLSMDIDFSSRMYPPRDGCLLTCTSNDRYSSHPISSRLVSL